MARGNNVTLSFAGDSTSLERTFKKVSGDANQLQGHFSKLRLGIGSALKIGAASAIATKALDGLTAAAKVGWDEFSHGLQVNAQTTAALKSTGRAAGVTKQHIQNLAGQLMKLSGTDDEAVQSSENLLLTFTNLKNGVGKGNQIFDQATRASLDLSTAFGKDLNSSTVLVGKALNDPIKGLSALSRVGVSFTDGQKEQIKAMVAAGNTMGAQKLILGELTKETGGSAAAFGKTLPGQLDIAKQTLANFAGDVTAKVVPVLAATVRWVSDHWPEISGVISAVFAAVQGAVQTGIGFIQTNIVPPIQAVIDGVKAVWDRFAPIVKAAFDAVSAIVGPALSVIKDLVKIPLELLRGDWGAVWDSLKDLAGNALHLVVDVVTGIGKILWAAVRALAQGVYDAFMAPIRPIYDAVKGVIDNVVSFVGGIPGRIGKILSGMWSALSSGLSSAVGAVQSALGPIVSIVDGLRSAIQWVIDHLPGGGSSVNVSTVTTHGGLTPPRDITKTGIVPPRHAFGGVFTSPHFGLVAEAGPEAIVPLSRPARAAEVLRQAGLTGRAGGTTVIHNHYATINTAADGAAVIRALDSWERSNGRRYARAS